MTAVAAFMLKKEFKDTKDVTLIELKTWVLNKQLQHGGDFLGHLTGKELKEFAEQLGLKIKR